MSKLLKASSLTLIIILGSIFSNSLYAAPKAAEMPDITNTSVINPNPDPNTKSITEPTQVSTECLLTREPVGLIFDRSFSPVVGAQALITLDRVYQWLDDRFLPSTAHDNSFLMVAGRFSKEIFETLLSTTFVIIQHEIFGHGARAREFHVPVTRYSIGILSGTTYLSDKYFQVSPSEQIAIDAGGVEATGILARQLQNRWLASQFIDSREANLYFFSYTDQTFYILGSKAFARDNTFPEGHDINNYVNLINKWNPNSHLSTGKLRKKTLIDFLNPYLYYSLYSIGLYVGDGCQTWEYPMINIMDYKYLPMFRLALAPYGPEYQFINLIKTPEHIISATFRYGNTGNQRSSALALEVSDILTFDKLFIDGKAEVWKQPKLFTQFATGSNMAGVAASVIARYQCTKQFFLVGQVGYKTTGFIPGEELKRAPILRVGFLFNM